MSKNVLIIGAGGFIGGYIADESLRRGFTTGAGVRESTSRKFLSDPRLKFLIFDYENPEQMSETLKESLPAGEKWDYVIHNLGATKCTNFNDFNRINYEYLRNTIEALRKSDMIPERFVLISSLSALGPGDEENFSPITEKQIPLPNTRYGVSKIKAETFLESCGDIPWTILRPTGVYGPHEEDYLMMIKSIDSHWDFGVGFKKQLLTFIYAADLAKAVFDTLKTEKTLRQKYIISEPKAYTQKEFRQIVSEKLGRKFVIPLRLPLWIVGIASWIAEKYGVAKMKATTLNSDKFKIMKQRNWNCSVEKAQNDFDFKTDYPLERGIEETVKHYREEKQKSKKK
ncbi:MAG: NAD(P)-dependent oxidoreductase [Paramuribaculum sp.]|nr:NAD(P)-dependent oxidoreductase [Paramuribaculum sp.]